MESLSKQSVGELFSSVLQHMKCIQTRIEYASALTSKQDRYVLTNASKRVESAINSICSLLPNKEDIQVIKKELESPDFVYVMLLIVSLYNLPNDDLDEVVDLIQNFIDKKYGKSESKVSDNEEGSL